LLLDEEQRNGNMPIYFCDVRKSQLYALEVLPAQFPQNPSNLAKFPHFSRKRELIKSFVYLGNACKLLTSATLTR